jgi:ABC-type uncharacterized transport system permease subunit
VTDVLVALLLVLPPFDIVVALRLWQLSRRNPGIVSLRERAVNAAALALAASCGGILAWSRVGVLRIGPDASLTLLALALVVVSVPALYWLGLLLSGRFREDRE